MASVGLAFAALVLISLPTTGNTGLLTCPTSGELDCASILAGPWAYWFGQVPLRWLGVGVYLGSLIVCWGHSKSFITWLRPLAACIWGACLWLIVVQALILGSFCFWCCTAHLAASAAALCLWSLGSLVTNPARQERSGPWIAAALTIAVLASGGAWKAPPTANTPRFAEPSVESLTVFAKQDDTLHFLNSPEFSIPSASVPSIGPAGAKHAFAVLMNHACPHCVRLAEQLGSVMGELYDQDLVVYFVPVASKPEVAEAQAALLALWAASPEVHNKVASKLYRGLLSLNSGVIQSEAATHLGDAALAGAFSAKRLSAARQQIALHGRIVREAADSHGYKGLPQMWFPDGAELGMAENTGFYFQMLARHLGVSRAVAPKLAIEKPEVDLGRTPASSRLIQTLKLANHGTGALRIAGLEMPPGWSLIQKLPLEVPPSEQINLEIELLSPAQSGKWQQTAKLLSNSSTTEPTAVTFRGVAVHPLEPPVTEIALADVVEGARASAEVRPFAAASDFTLGEIAWEMPGYTAAWSDDSRSALRFEPLQRLPLGGHVGRMSLPAVWKGSSHAWSVPTLEIKVTAQVRAPVIVTPLRIVLPPLRLTQAQDYSIAIRPRDGKTPLSPTVVLPAGLSQAGVYATIGKPDERQGLEVTLRFPADFDPATHVGSEVKLHSGITHGSATLLPVELSGRRAPGPFARNGNLRPQPLIQNAH